MVAPRPLAGAILGFALAYSKGHVRVDKGMGGPEESRGEGVASADE